MNPAETREAIVQHLYRSLFGPTDDGTSAWLGKPDPHELIIKDGVSWDQPRPVGHWVNEDNDEVLSSPPFFVYGVGVLFPRVSAAIQSEIDGMLVRDEQDDTDDIEPSDKNSSIADLSSDDTDANVDDSSQTTESTTRPRSMAISVRISNEIEEVSLVLTGGTYSQVNVGNQPHPWWSRKHRKVEMKLAVLTTSEEQVQLGDVSVTVGCSVRVLDSDTKIATVWIRNDTEASSAVEFSAKCLFQTQLTIAVADLLPYDRIATQGASSLELLYRNELRLAAGHGVDATAEKVSDGWKVKSNSMPIARLHGLTPDVPYSIGMVDLGEFNSKAVSGINRLILDYETWISEKKLESQELSSEYLKVAQKNIESCQSFIDRIKIGWTLVQENSDVRKVLSDMSLAMNKQRIAYGSPLRDVQQLGNSEAEFQVIGVNPHTLQHEQSSWRAFQIAFILASLNKVVNQSEDLETPVDVIWMPTGGGKTEAYLGLAGFVILWERLIKEKSNSNWTGAHFTKVFMRYTLRLLTSQQLTRASSLICALELTRQNDVSSYGINVIRIGAWLGSKTSPNTHEAARILYGQILNKKSDGKSFMITRCPWCGARMGHVLGTQVVGYKKVSHPDPSVRTQRVMAYCPADDCEFKFREINHNRNTTYTGIPVLEVDEDIYLGPPDFVVGTIDKVARLAWVPEAQAIFGLRKGKRKYPAPRLLIQDELHLIAGPLGSIDGVYEALIEHLCRVDGGAKPVIVASTATTKNFEDQLQKLYGRPGELVPPPGLDITDSFFAKRDLNDSGKIYVAVCATGYGSNLNSQTRVLAMLAHCAGVLRNIGEKPDAWWTNIIFFSSRRALGQLHSTIETGLRNILSRLRAVSGASSGSQIVESAETDQVLEKQGHHPTRLIRNLKQLTSTSTDNLNQVLDDLSIAIDGKENNPIDMCLATSMIEVGLDVPRLGLMTVIGQPKSASQYIQVSGRVGRNRNSPGLIVTVLSPQNVRDRSHYESFSDWHNRLYASVENSSVTPYTSRALERSAPSVLAALLRIFGHEKNVRKSYENYWAEAVDVLKERAEAFGSLAVESLKVQLGELERIISSKDAAGTVWDKSYGENDFFIYTADDVIPPERADSAYWRVLNSMRNVEGDSGFRMSQAVASERTVSAEQDQVQDDAEQFLL